jgi:pimeloyl-ACP methyl ester carboxylesterase
MNDVLAEPPEAFLARLDAAATRMETPTGAGNMVWRSWGSGPVLVLLHGGSGSWRHWVRNIEYFARDRRVIAPDLPGLGESDMPELPHSAINIAGIGRTQSSIWPDFPSAACCRAISRACRTGCAASRSAVRRA